MTLTVQLDRSLHPTTHWLRVLLCKQHRALAGVCRQLALVGIREGIHTKARGEGRTSRVMGRDTASILWDKSAYPFCICKGHLLRPIRTHCATIRKSSPRYSRLSVQIHETYCAKSKDVNVAMKALQITVQTMAEFAPTTFKL